MLIPYPSHHSLLDAGRGVGLHRHRLQRRHAVHWVGGAAHSMRHRHLRYKSTKIWDLLQHVVTRHCSACKCLRGHAGSQAERLLSTRVHGARDYDGEGPDPRGVGAARRGNPPRHGWRRRCACARCWRRSARTAPPPPPTPHPGPHDPCGLRQGFELQPFRLARLGASQNQFGRTSRTGLPPRVGHKACMTLKSKKQHCLQLAVRQYGRAVLPAPLKRNASCYCMQTHSGE